MRAIAVRLSRIVARSRFSSSFIVLSGGYDFHGLSEILLDGMTTDMMLILDYPMSRNNCPEDTARIGSVNNNGGPILWICLLQQV